MNIPFNGRNFSLGSRLKYFIYTCVCVYIKEEGMLFKRMKQFGHLELTSFKAIFHLWYIRSCKMQEIITFENL